MKACLLNFVHDLFKFPWTREEFLSCNSFRESYDTFHGRIGDCSFDEYVEFFKEFNLECSTLEKSGGRLSDEQLEQISGGGIGRLIAIPMVALTLLSGVSSVTGFATSINAPKAVSFQADARDEIQDEWAKTRDFVARAGDPWLSLLPVKGEAGFDEYKNPEADFDEVEGVPNGEKVVLGEGQEGDHCENVYPQIYEIVQNFMDYADGKKDRGKLPKNLGEIVDVADRDVGNVTQGLSRDLKVAKYIYVWIAKNIKYDGNLCNINDNSEYDYRAKPGVVFERRDGICGGFARLARLMMRMAEIPCAYVASPVDESTHECHAFNAIYVEKTNGEKGWTLMDATWGMQGDVKDGEGAKEKEKRLHDYFPAVYDNKSLKDNNRSVIRETYHQVKYIDDDFVTSYILNGVKYTVNDDSISVSSEEAGAHLSLQIPESIIALNKKIEIGEGIEKYKCSKTEEIDISRATNLKEVNTEDSERYKFADGVLYEKVKDREGNEEDKSVGILLDIGAFHYRLRGSYVYVYADSETPDFPEIPDSILSLNKKIKIGDGITKYKCSGNERIDISEATNLESIDTYDSDVYSKLDEDGVLYYREDRSVADLAPGASVVVGRVKYYRDQKDFHSITVSSKDSVSPCLQVPPDLALNSKIKIGSGIYNYKCSGDEKIDISGAWNLQSIDTEKSNIYEEFKDGVLYYKEGYEGYKKDGGVADLIPGSLVKRGEFRYLREYNDCNSIYVYHVYNDPNSPATLKVPPDILALGLKIKIGSGINKYISSGNEVIDILGAEYKCLGNETIEW